MRPRGGREASFDRSLGRPHDGDVVARPEASVGGHERKIAVEAMGDQHAVEWIAIIPVERARRFRVRPADRDLGKARRTRGGARRSLERELGVNLIDTANVYSGGSEELIGEAMGHKRKPGMLIATKARFPMGEGPNDRGLSRWHLIREFEASLKRKPLCAMSAVPTVL